MDTPEDAELEQTPSTEIDQSNETDFYLVWEVWSVSPRGFRQSCKRIFPHEEWQFAEKLAARLRDRGHEDVEVELSTREDMP